MTSGEIDAMRGEEMRKRSWTLVLMAIVVDGQSEADAVAVPNPLTDPSEGSTGREPRESVLGPRRGGGTEDSSSPTSVVGTRRAHQP
jgi:hypothetical protein